MFNNIRFSPVLIILIVLNCVLIGHIIIKHTVKPKTEKTDSTYMYKEQFLQRIEYLYPDGTIYFSPHTSTVALVLEKDSIFAIQNQGYELEIVKMIKQ